MFINVFAAPTDRNSQINPPMMQKQSGTHTKRFLYLAWYVNFSTVCSLDSLMRDYSIRVPLRMIYGAILRVMELSSGSESCVIKRGVVEDMPSSSMRGSVI